MYYAICISICDTLINIYTHCCSILNNFPDTLKFGTVVLNKFELLLNLQCLVIFGIYIIFGTHNCYIFEPNINSSH